MSFVRTGAARILVIALALGMSLATMAAPTASASGTTLGSEPNVVIADDVYTGDPASLTSDTIDTSAIPANQVVNNITIQVALDHTWVGDLTIKLTSPAGTVLTLLQRAQGDGIANSGADDDADTPSGDSSNLSSSSALRFSDAYANNPETMGIFLGSSEIACFDDSICDFYPNPDQAISTGSVSNFAAFDGETAGGNWSLGIGDSRPGDTGTFVSWSINLGYQLRTSWSRTAAPNVAITDNLYNGSLVTMTSDTIDASTIPAGHVVTDVTVRLLVNHASVGDLTVKLFSPSGTSLALIERPRGDGLENNDGDDGLDSPRGDDSNLSSESWISFNDAYADDPENMGLGIGSSESVCADDDRCQFFPNPDEALGTGSETRFAGFDGEPAGGSWTLLIGDGAAGDLGAFISWNITIRHALPLTSCGEDSPFSDVAYNHPFCAEIKWMKDSEISTGFDAGATYRPLTAVTRQAMSAFMARLFGAQLTACSTPPFPDVAIGHPFCPEIKWMNETAISTGFGDGTYRPGTAVTRQAMAAFMARLARATLPICKSAPFVDVPMSHPFCREIQWMKTSGISTGFNDGTEYRPSTAVTRQAMSAFMFRVSSMLRLP
jgi:subtilisin-like proprotein convertase family protein